MSSVPLLPLNDGSDMPQIGLGAYRNDSIEKTIEIALRKIDDGINHLELSELYGNGHFIVESALDRAEIGRENIFITLKVWPNNKKKSELIETCKSTLRSLAVEYVDLCIIHAPLNVTRLLDQWKALEILKNEGYCRSIGVGKLTQTHLSEIIKNANILPSVVEV
jgi:diketogulonate reductase-like aldo/keto reductase